MLNINLLRALRLKPTKLIKAAPLCTKKGKTSSESSSSSSSDDERALNKTNLKKRSEEAREKLNLLLTKMVQEDSSKEKSSLKFAKAKDHRKRDVRKEAGTESVKSEPIDKGVVKAVQDVAESLGGDVKQTESELLQKLLNPVKEEASSTLSLNDLFKGMQIDREVKKVDTSRAEQVRQALQNVQPKAAQSHRVTKKRKPHQLESVPIDEQVNLHIEQRLEIFNPEEVCTWPDSSMNSTWHALHQRELQLSVTHPPSNYFQQMILWTNQGKIWKFPIDNEQDLDEEKKVYFTEHIFLDKHLEGWCPSKGPLRHFMELVCVGLSKNPYLTVQMKKEHIEWFRDYFKEKKQLLSEVGAFPAGFDIDQGVQKVVESNEKSN
ncbi:hypothetical protein RN001_015310 [Aquatica leii]|uniref:Small ribosomal subunit protein mS31 n=1 Tax=Aquatica leii TaxID=1421715 RepID=A0AAN7P0W1_9COLE|nr:hypothetical protein RN001_015310 [Aquatica leii]